MATTDSKSAPPQWLLQKNHAESSAPGHWFLEKNPLLEGIPNFPDPGVFLEHLSFSPLAGLEVTKLGFMDRHDLLVGEKTPLRPTTQSLRAAMTWYGMLRVSLRVRNPLRVEARRNYWNALNSIANDVEVMPSGPTQGIAVQVVKGPTGTAKTVTAKRFCAMLGRQRIDHGPRPEAGWNDLRQLVYLYSDLSHDGTRGGFLTALLMQVDLVLGTNYAVDLPKRHKTIERLAVATVGRLIAHYTGILFIDEGQLRNLMFSDQADLMQMFLLALMNSGIPLVLIGNERAFDWIDYSQDLTRLNVVPSEYFHPVGATNHVDTDDDWDTLYLGISEYYLLDNPPSDSLKCKSVLRQCSGGVPRLGLILWTTAQTNVLVKGGCQLSPDDIIAAYNNSKFDDLRPLADGFGKRLPELLLRYPDVDAHHYARCWGKPFPKIEACTKPAHLVSNTKTPRTHPPRSSRRGPQSGKAKFKAEQTRKQNEQAIRDELSKTLGPDDMRKEGIKQFQLQGLEAARRRVESAGSE